MQESKKMLKYSYCCNAGRRYALREQFLKVYGKETSLNKESFCWKRDTVHNLRTVENTEFLKNGGFVWVHFWVKQGKRQLRR